MRVHTYRRAQKCHCVSANSSSTPLQRGYADRVHTTRLRLAARLMWLLETLTGRSRLAQSLIAGCRILSASSASIGWGETGRVAALVGIPRDFCAASGPGAPLRKQRHVADSIATLRLELAAALLACFERCPCCG